MFSKPERLHFPFLKTTFGFRGDVPSRASFSFLLPLKTEPRDGPATVYELSRREIVGLCDYFILSILTSAKFHRAARKMKRIKNRRSAIFLPQENASQRYDPADAKIHTRNAERFCDDVTGRFCRQENTAYAPPQRCAGAGRSDSLDTA